MLQHLERHGFRGTISHSTQCNSGGRGLTNSELAKLLGLTIGEYATACSCCIGGWAFGCWKCMKIKLMLRRTSVRCRIGGKFSLSLNLMFDFLSISICIFRNSTIIITPTKNWSIKYVYTCITVAPKTLAGQRFSHARLQFKIFTNMVTVTITTRQKTLQDKIWPIHGGDGFIL